MNLANSSLRSFTLLDSKNALIFSTISLSSEFSTQISIAPLTVQTLGASFDLDIQQWRTSERTCVILRFPMVAEKQRAQYHSFPVFGFATAETVMCYEELRQRCIIYFRVCQAILQQKEFNAPWSFQLNSLSISLSYLLSILCSAERLLDHNPSLLNNAFMQYPSIQISILEQQPVEASKLVGSIQQNIKETYVCSQNGKDLQIPIEMIQETINQMMIVLFIDNKVVNLFSAATLADQNYIRLDPIDMIILTILQSDDAFIHGRTASVKLAKEEKSEALMNVFKTDVTQFDENCVIGTDDKVEADGSRILSMRFQNKQISVVTQFRQLDLGTLPESNDILNARLCYLHPINKNLSTIYQMFDSNQQQLIVYCKNIVNMYVAPVLESKLNQCSDHLLINLSCPERHFSIRHQISAFPGLLQMTFVNRTRGSMLSSDLDFIEQDLQLDCSKDILATQFVKSPVKHNFLNFPSGLVRVQKESPSLVMDYSQLDQDTLVQQIIKQGSVTRIQTIKLLEFANQSLKQGLSYAVERDEQFMRIFYLFYFNIEDFSKCNIFDQNNSNAFCLPLSRQQIADLNQCEEVYPNRRLEYLEQGGYVGSSQYFMSMDKLARESKVFKRNAGQLGSSGNFELFQVQATLLKFVDIKDIQSIIVEILGQFVSLIWKK